MDSLVNRARGRTNLVVFLEAKAEFRDAENLSVCLCWLG